MRLLSLLAFCLTVATASGVDFAKSIPANCRKVLLVIAPDWSATNGTLRCYQRSDADSPWHTIGQSHPVLLGRRGLAWGLGLHTETPLGGPRKVEGDGRAPAGVFALGSAFGNAPRGEIAWLHFPYRQITPTTEAIDDPTSRSYNHIVDRAQISQPDWRTTEHMARIPEYELGVVIAHNAEGKPGAGSCIFLHLWTDERNGTAGCTALHRADLVEVLHWLDSASHPALVQLPAPVAQECLSGF